MAIYLVWILLVKSRSKILSPWWLTIHGTSPDFDFMSLVLLALHLVLILLLKSMYQISSLSTIPSGRFWIVGDLLWDGGWPSCGWLWVKSRCQISSLVQYLLVDFGRWVTILGMVSDHPRDGGWPSMTPYLVLILWVESSCQISSL